MTEEDLFAVTDFGTVIHKGRAITIIQQPYLGAEDRIVPYYTAIGQDEKGNEYQIEWPDVDITVEDESDACDWGSYTVKRCFIYGLN